MIWLIKVHTYLQEYNNIHYWFINKLDGVPVPERVKTATRQMIISNF